MPPWEARVPVSPRRRRQTEIKDKARPGREQNRCKGFFSKLTEGGSPLLFRTNGGGPLS
jgi:hypothetical protein